MTLDLRWDIFRCAECYCAIVCELAAVCVLLLSSHQLIYYTHLACCCHHMSVVVGQEGLLDHPALEYLDVSWNGIDDAGVRVCMCITPLMCPQT